MTILSRFPKDHHPPRKTKKVVSTNGEKNKVIVSIPESVLMRRYDLKKLLTAAEVFSLGEASDGKVLLEIPGDTTIFRLPSNFVSICT